MMSTVGMIYATGDKICATGCNIYTAGVKILLLVVNFRIVFLYTIYS